ncbi:MAG: hypothetical protein JSR59_26670 [Proteobacteria bacterium]|nr:hypothetical protein [Pseudomonadota bacterium]
MDRVDVLLEPVRALLVQVGAFLPRLVLAILVVIAGVLIAKAIRFAVRRALRAINFHVVTRRSGMDGFLQIGGGQTDGSDLFALLCYWLVILASLVVAANGLGLTYVTELLGRITVFVPRLLVALVILVFGAYFARFVGGLVEARCRRAGIGDADALGAAARYAVLAFVIMIALDHLDIGGQVIRDAFLILLGGVVLALALAFGLGGRGWAAARLERWWPTRSDSPLPDELKRRRERDAGF